MSNYCEDCGCKVYSGRCTNCHDELYILEQYYEQDMELPDENSDFMKKVNEQKKAVSEKERSTCHYNVIDEGYHLLV